MKRIMILAPHTDDGEFGCGGTISRFIREGDEVFYIAFSSAEKSVPEQFSRTILREEVLQATAVLGIPESNVLVLNFEVRDFPSRRQEILETMVDLHNKYRPDMVFLPSTSDTHQDHQTISNEGFRAFKRCTILGYELPWNNLEFKCTSFVILEERDVRKKMEALEKYKSQAHRKHASPDYMLHLAQVRGFQAFHQWAECFEVIRWINSI